MWYFSGTCRNLLDFIDAYRIGDAIAIEYRYQKHSTVWKALNQSKYVEIFLGQQETLYQYHPYSQLMELRLSRVVWRYHGSTGKRCVAQDEFLELEHGNRFFSEFPMPKSLIGFADQSLYIGVELMCKQFATQWYTTSFKPDDSTLDYTSRVKLSTTPERKLVYEVFSLLGTYLCDKIRSTSLHGKSWTCIGRRRL